MPITGAYEPSAWDWVRDQVAEYEASGGTRANTLMDTGLPIIVLTTRGNKSGKVRKMALMRVEHDGEYALVASQGGMPTNPAWYYNLKANPRCSTVFRGQRHDMEAYEAEGDERQRLWELDVSVYPPRNHYAQRAGDRRIPVMVLRPAPCRPADMPR